jgi:MFS family permease
LSSKTDKETPARALKPVLLVAAATALSLLGDQTLYAVLPSHYTHLGLLPIHVGILLSANRWVRLLSNHPAERLCRRWPPAPLLGIALGVGALTTALYALFPSFLLLLAARLAWGISWSFIRQIGLMTVVDSTAPENMGRMMGLYSGLSRFGSISGNMLGALGHDLIGFSGVLLLFAALSSVGVPLGVWGRWGVVRRGIRTAEEEGAAGGHWGVLVGGFVIGCVGHGLIMSTLGAVLKARVGESVQVGDMAVGVATLTGFLLAGRWIADLVAPLLGAFGDRVGRRQAALVFFAGGTLILGGASVAPGALLLVGLVLGYFVCATGASVALMAQAGSGGARGVARYVTASDLGAAVGPMLGWVAPQLGLPMQVSLVCGGALYAVAVLAAWQGMAPKE